MSPEMQRRQSMASNLQNPVVHCNSILLQGSVTVHAMMTVGDRVRAARQAKVLTMKDLARAIGKNESYISELERGGIKRGSHLHRIADVLGIPLHWLETGTGPTVLGGRQRVSEVATAYPSADLLAAYRCASARTRAAVDLLLLPESERAAAIGGDSALVAGVALIEEHAADALRKRKTA